MMRFFFGLGRNVSHGGEASVAFARPMKRYLLFLSYIGTHFRGVQKQAVKTDPELLDPLSIQGVLEIALQRFKFVNTPHVFVSSRTDQGVHALRTSAHVDLDVTWKDFNPSFLVYGLNRYFEKAKIDVRVQSCQIVPDTFHARHSAVSRTYLYRLAVRRPDLPRASKNGKYLFEVPMSEWKRCHFIHDDNFDVKKVQETITLFPGVHDFRAFMGSAAHQNKVIRTVRRLNRLDFEPGRPLLRAEYSPSTNLYTFYDITFNAQSFLYRQVRRTVGALIAVAQGRIAVDRIRSMLEEPSVDSWDPRAVTVPPHGLYLVDVEYRSQDLVSGRPITALVLAHEKLGHLLTPTMSLLASLLHKRQELKPSETRVTTPDGLVHVERTGADGSVVSSVPKRGGAGFVVDTQPDLQVAWILPGLAMGSQDVAQDEGVLQENGITHVLGLGAEPGRDATGRHLHVAMLDLGETRLVDALPPCFGFVDRALAGGGRVYVHCNAGVSRSAAVVVAYLMAREGRSYEEAYAHVKGRRPVARPNDGFVAQLRELEAELDTRRGDCIRAGPE